MSRKSKTISSIIKTLGVLFALWIIFSWIYSSTGSDIAFEDTIYEPSEEDIVQTPEFAGDTVVYTFGGEFFSHELEWMDNNQNEYVSEFKVHVEYLEPSKKYRERIRSSASWTKLYGKLAAFDDGKLDDIVHMYEDIKNENDLNEKEFADMVVTSIQNIPYALIHEYSHDEADSTWSDFDIQYHKDGKPCLDNVKFGLQSPVEFMSNFKGDCDTRSLLCYLILDDFGFDVAMLGSDEYTHEVLGISGNYRGSYVKKNAIKYYTWETTATGYGPGVMSTNCSDMDYWVVDICSRD